MADMTPADEKIGEVLGLAMAAQDATSKVEGLVEDEAILAKLQEMCSEAEETERRCTELADTRDGLKTAILDKAAETKKEAKDMMSTYLGSDAEGLDGFEFLTMAEAGELGHWEIVKRMSDTIGEQEVGELADWAVDVQRRHFDTVRESSLELAVTEVRS